MHLGHGGRELPVEARNIVGQEPAPPEILRPDCVGAVPEQRGDQRRADFLAGFQKQLCDLLARDNPQAALAVASQGTGPLPGPADGEDQAAARHLEIEVRPTLGAIGRTAPVRRERVTGLGAERELARLVTLRCAPVALVAVENELVFRAPRQLHIQRLEVFQDRAVRLARVLQEDGPFGHREIAVVHRDTTHLQAGTLNRGQRRLGTAITQRHVAKPKFFAVGQRHLGVAPV